MATPAEIRDWAISNYVTVLYIIKLLSVVFTSAMNCITDTQLICVVLASIWKSVEWFDEKPNHHQVIANKWELASNSVLCNAFLEMHSLTNAETLPMAVDYELVNCITQYN